MISTQNTIFEQFESRLKGSFFVSFLIPGIENLKSVYGQAYKSDFEKHLVILEKSYRGEDFIGHLVDAYVSFNKDILKEEKYFQQNQQYTHTQEDFGKVCDQVYHNEEIMTGYYLTGLFLTYFCWPHHYQMLNFYREKFLGQGVSHEVSFMDWGAGHGLFSLLVLEKNPKARGLIYDISPFSIQFATKLLGAKDYLPQCQFICKDIFAVDHLAPSDFIICSELLEHVADPGLLIKKIQSHLKPGGKVFLTAAINSAQRDHIYCFRSSAEIFDLVKQHQMTVQDSIEVVHPNRVNHSIKPLVLALVAQNKG